MWPAAIKWAVTQRAQRKLRCLAPPDARLPSEHFVTKRGIMRLIASQSYQCAHMKQWQAPECRTRCLLW